MTSVRCGIIGCGGMGTRHAKNLANHSGMDVVAVADTMPDAAGSLAALLGARVSDAFDLIAADDVDAVLIASSNDSHATLATAVIATGKPLFLEKPIGVTVEQAQSVLNAEVSTNRRSVRVGFMRELDPAHAQVVEALAELGPVIKVRCVHRNVDVERRDAPTLFAESLIHDIHTIRWITGSEFTNVAVHVAERSDGFREILLVARLANGVLGTIEFADQAYAYEVHVEVTAEAGMAATLPHPRAVVSRDAAAYSTVGIDWFGRFEEAYRREIHEWADSISSPIAAPGGPTVWDGYAAQVVAEAGVQALVTGESVAVELPAQPALYRSMG